MSDPKPFARLVERLPPVSVIHDLLDFRADWTVYWKSRPATCFSSVAVMNRWNARNAGKQTFVNMDGAGYPTAKFAGRTTRLHAVVFKVVHGYEPVQIDHIDGNPLNNHPENLRAADPSVNMRNMGIGKRNTSGIRGVHPSRSSPGKWCAQIRAKGKTITLGTFDDLETAAKARRDAEIEHGYQPPRIARVRKKRMASA